MNDESSIRVLELQYIILDSFSKIKLSLEEIEERTGISSLDAKIAIRNFAAEMVQLSHKLAVQNDNRMMVDDLLKNLKKENEDEDPQ